MGQDTPAASAEAQDLVITRHVRAPRATLWRAWSDPELLKEWWCPRPWTTEVRAFDMRPGGAFHTFMQGPDGGSSDNPGCLPRGRAAAADRLQLAAARRLAAGDALDALHRDHHAWPTKARARATSPP